MPARIQRKRTKGWRMPDSTVYVGRPTRWGNPFAVGEYGPLDRKPIDNDGAVGFFIDMLKDADLQMECCYPSEDHIREELCGKDLACWCPLDQPCHADVLLEIANGINRGEGE